MPLRDHFRPPLRGRRHPESLHVVWLGTLLRNLAAKLPTGYYGDLWTRWRDRECGLPPAAFELRVLDERAGSRTVAVITLLSEQDKESAAARHDFAHKCAGYLRQRAGVLLIDVVTTSRSDLRGEILSLLGRPREEKWG